MKSKDVKLGDVYLAKVSGRLVEVRVLCESPYGGYDATNLATGRRVHMRTAARLRPWIYLVDKAREAANGEEKP